MAEKKKMKKIGEALGISGFTLGIAGIYALIVSGIFSLPFFIIGLIFCAIQQKKNPTKLGKAGLIINILSIIITIIIVIVLMTYLYPLIQEQLSNLT